jgi:hypothetical protein
MIRTIKVSTGVKRIDDQNRNNALIKLREVLTDERRILINRLQSDINAYVQYRFSKKVDGRQVEKIKGKLDTLKNSNVDLDHYEPIVNAFFRHENSHVSFDLFYREIDECLSGELMPVQLKLVN